MAKRFIDTGFFKSPFVRGLEAPLKALYVYLMCESSGAGIWPVDFEVAEIYTGQKLDRKKAEATFIESGKVIDLGDGKWFIPGFIEHQYPKGLSDKNPAHNNVILELIKYKLIEPEKEGGYKPLWSTFQGTKVMVMVEGMVKDMGTRLKFSKPDIIQIQNFMDERNVNAGRVWSDAKILAEAKNFFNHYESNGWKVGKNAMKDWQAAVRNWMNNSNKFSQTKQNQNGREEQRKQGISELRKAASAILTGQGTSSIEAG